MSIDVSQFHQVFFEESFEGLDLMEMGLLSMQEGRPDSEIIDTIFRAAHSIKGGAGTFGFSQVSIFTHGLETLLDQIRTEERDVTRDAVNVMLQAVDILRDMLHAVQQGADMDDTRAAEVSTRIEALLQSDDPAPAVQVDTVAEADSNIAPAGWNINFKPHSHLLQTGNDPVRMIRELGELGEIKVSLDDSALPAFSELEPEECYLGWTIELQGEVSLEQINEIFEWVEGDCDLVITPIPALTAETEEPLSPAPPVEEPLQPASQDKPTRASQSSKNPTDSAMSSIRVGTDKVDSLVNLVGELVITQSMLSQLGEDFDASRLPQLIDGLEQLERNTRELQEGIMRIRMLPISFTFNRFPRLVHDLSAKMGKQVELKFTGEQTELDKTVMEKIGDPLLHLVRNSLDHGLETPDKRLAAGKAETGLLHLNAYHQGGNIVIEISDDGAGLNEDRILQNAIERGLVNDSEPLTPEKIHELIFMPGFSTAEAVSDVSGRGVGMDVVRKNINSLGGSVDVRSEPGLGSTFTIRLPLTLAIMDGQTIQVADQRYIIPLISIVESVEIKPGMVKNVTGKGEVFSLRDEYLPLIRLHELFNLVPRSDSLEDGLLVVVEHEGRKIGLFVDELLAQQQVVIKSLEINYRRVTGMAGATILGDGTVALILDIAGLQAMYRDPSLQKAAKKDRAA